MKKIFVVSIFLFSFLFISPVYSHAQAESLYIRTNKSYVELGSFYNLTVLSSHYLIHQQKIQIQLWLDQEKQRR